MVLGWRVATRQRWHSAGGFDTRNLFSRRVLVVTEHGDLKGVMNPGGMPIHISSDAERIGLAYRDGQPVRVGTANGLAQGWRVKLASVRIGDVEVYEVDAVVTPQGMPFVLLGNSYLNRFQMRRDNDQMVLERRY